MRLAQRALLAAAGIESTRDSIDAKTGSEMADELQADLKRAFDEMPGQLVRFEIRCNCPGRHLLAKVVRTTGDYLLASYSNPLRPTNDTGDHRRDIRRGMGRRRLYVSWVGALGTGAPMRIGCARCGTSAGDSSEIKSWIARSLKAKRSSPLILPREMRR